MFLDRSFAKWLEHIDYFERFLSLFNPEFQFPESKASTSVSVSGPSSLLDFVRFSFAILPLGFFQFALSLVRL